MAGLRGGSNVAPNVFKKDKHVLAAGIEVSTVCVTTRGYSAMGLWGLARFERQSEREHR